MSDTRQGQARYRVAGEVVTQAQADTLRLLGDGTDPRGLAHPRTITDLIKRGLLAFERVTYRPVLTERGAEVADRLRRADA